MREPAPATPVPNGHDPLQWRAQSLNSAGFFRFLHEVISRMPEDLTEHLGEVISDWVGFYLPKVHEALRRNLSVVKPGLPDAEYRELARRTIVNYSLGVKDYLLHAAGKLSRFEMAGEPSPGLRERMDEGKGFILVSAHFGNFEMGAALLQRYGLRGTIVALPEEVAAIDALRVGTRAGWGAETLAVGSDLETFLVAKKRLADGGALAMLVERHLPRNELPVKFFGRDCKFLRTPAQLARHTGAPLVPVAALRVGQSRYLMDCGEPIYFPGTRNEADLVEGMQQIADYFEAHIRRNPDHWFNFYDYFGKREAGA